MTDLAEIDLARALPELKAWARTMARCGEAMALYVEFTERHGMAPNCRRPLELERRRRRSAQALEQFNAAQAAFHAALTKGEN